MNRYCACAALSVFLLPTTSCSDYATFVTATNIGISADTTTQDVSIGYVRTELFTGPGYPQQGEAPAAIGFLHSDLSPAQPQIRQLYATGDAAELVTEPGVPVQLTQTQLQAQAQARAQLQAQALAQALAQSQPAATGQSASQGQGYYGERRPLAFGTGTNFGLKVGFSGGTAPAPSSIKLGYNREELSIIPLRHDQPTKENQDKYAPVLAAIDMDLAAKGVTDTSADLTQFFATGSAARNLAANPEIQGYFNWKASAAVKQAAGVQQEIATVLAQQDTNYNAIVTYFAKATGDFATARNRLVTAAGLSTDPLYGAKLSSATTPAQFLAIVKPEQGLIGTLGPIAAKLTLTP